MNKDRNFHRRVGRTKGRVAGLRSERLATLASSNQVFLCADSLTRAYREPSFACQFLATTNHSISPRLSRRPPLPCRFLSLFFSSTLKFVSTSTTAHTHTHALLCLRPSFGLHAAHSNSKPSVPAKDPYSSPRTDPFVSSSLLSVNLHEAQGTRDGRRFWTMLCAIC